MPTHSYATDSQTKSTDLAARISAASSPPHISAACAAIDSFLHNHTPDQARWFFSITFPTLICKLFGFDDSLPRNPNSSSNGWIDVITASSNDSELPYKVFSLLSPNSVLMSSISAVDRLSLVKYVFPVERLPEWVRFILQNDRDCRVLADLCPLFRGRVLNKGSSFQVQLNVFEYYMFWFAYYPVCKGNSENCDAIKVRRSRKSRLENWAYSIPVFANSKRGKYEKKESNLYSRLLYAYLHAFVPVCDVTAHQPYRSSLLHYSSGSDASVSEHAEFLVYTFLHFWLVDNDFSPFPLNVCKSFGVNFAFCSVLGETPPTPGLGEIVNVFVKYLNLSSIAISDGTDKVESTGSPRWRVSGSVDVVKSRDVCVRSVGYWNSLIQRPLYRFILRTFIFCPMETSITNASQVFSLWINYIEPWNISLEDFGGLDANVGMSRNDTKKAVTQSPSPGYSTSWQGFVLTNYLFYGSLVMHFFGFAHKFVHTDTEVIVQMVSKVLSILTSSKELSNLIKNVDIAFHSKASESSYSTLKNLHRFVPSIREKLQDWEDGLCENDADGSFLHENWNKDLRLFSDGDDGGQQLLQLFVLRAESELQALSGDNLTQNMRCLDSIKAQMGCFFGNHNIKTIPVNAEAVENQHPRDGIFSPRMVGNCKLTDIKYKGDWMKRPISEDEIAWLAKLLVTSSSWLNEVLGLDQQRETTGCEGPAWSYVEVGDVGNVFGPTETMKVVFCWIGAWIFWLVGIALKFMRAHGMRVNLRMLASKKIVTVLLIVVAFGTLKKAVVGNTL